MLYCLNFLLVTLFYYIKADSPDCNPPPSHCVDPGSSIISSTANQTVVVGDSPKFEIVVNSPEDQSLNIIPYINGCEVSDCSQQKKKGTQISRECIFNNVTVLDSGKKIQFFLLSAGQYLCQMPVFLFVEGKQDYKNYYVTPYFTCID